MEQNDATWKSFLYNLPVGTMKFVLNSTINTLPTNDNLKQWGKVTIDKCFCGKKQTLNHVLSCCKKFLEEGCYTFRHNSILSYISQSLDKQKFKCYVDIPDCRTSAGGTLPPNVVVSNLKPDIVIVDKSDKQVHIFVLTFPSEARIDTAHKLKHEKYQHFLTDITSLKPSLSPFEIGAHSGYISRKNKETLKSLHKF